MNYKDLNKIQKDRICLQNFFQVTRMKLKVGITSGRNNKVF